MWAEQAGVVRTRLDGKRAWVTCGRGPPAKLSPPPAAGSARKKLILTAKDVDPQSVRIFDWDARQRVSVKPLGKSSEEINSMRHRPAEIVVGGRVVARSSGSDLWKQHGTNFGLLLIFHTTTEATAAAAALQGQNPREEQGRHDTRHPE